MWIAETYQAKPITKIKALGETGLGFRWEKHEKMSSYKSMNMFLIEKSESNKHD